MCGSRDPMHRRFVGEFSGLPRPPRFGCAPLGASGVLPMKPSATPKPKAAGRRISPLQAGRYQAS